MKSAIGLQQHSLFFHFYSGSIRLDIVVNMKATCMLTCFMALKVLHHVHDKLPTMNWPGPRFTKCTTGTIVPQLCQFSPQEQSTCITASSVNYPAPSLPRSFPLALRLRTPNLSWKCLTCFHHQGKFSYLNFRSNCRVKLQKKMNLPGGYLLVAHRFIGGQSCPFSCIPQRHQSTKAEKKKNEARGEMAAEARCREQHLMLHTGLSHMWTPIHVSPIQITK